LDRRSRALRIAPLILVAAATAILFAQPAAAATRTGSSTTAAPANDNFVDAIALTADSGNVAGTNTDATDEPTEPFILPGAKGVWYSWTSPGPGVVDFNTCGSTLDTVLTAFTGAAVDALSLVANNDDGCALGSRQSRLVLTAAGEQFNIRVSGYHGAMGNFTLYWNFIPQPRNDNFENAEVIAGTPGSITGTTSASTSQLSEPAPDRGDGVWYSWTSTGPARFGTDSGVVDAYTGDTLATLTLVASGSGELIDVPAGTRVSLRVANASVVFTLSWIAVVIPPNDDFANAEAISGASGTVSGTTENATNEAGELTPPDGGGVWYSWTSTGRPTRFKCGVGSIDAFTGASLAALTPIGSGCGLPVDVRAGTVVSIRASGAPGGFTVSWARIVVPRNDNFDESVEIGRASGRVSGTTENATNETGEPTPPDGGGIWYEWQSPGGPTRFNCDAGTIDAFTGRNLAALTLLKSGCGLVVNVSRRTVVYVRVSLAAEGFTLSWLPAPPPRNDNIANAQVLTGDSASVAGTNLDATDQSGEPPGFGQNGVWYRWNAPGAGSATIEVCSGSLALDPVVEIFTGTTFATLVPVAADLGFCGFLTPVDIAAAGPYAIRVSGYNGSQGPFTLSWTFTRGPDTAPPTLTQADITAEATSADGAIVSYTATATDDQDPNPVVDCVPASGSAFPMGPTPVDCTVTDAAGNQSTGSFTVTVRDTTAPAVTCPLGVNAAGKPVKDQKSGFRQVRATDAVGVVSLVIASGRFRSGNLNSGDYVSLVILEGSAGKDKRPGPGVLVATITTGGVPYLVATDAAGNTARVPCWPSEDDHKGGDNNNNNKDDGNGKKK
jgi:hypothetical protein